MLDFSVCHGFAHMWIVGVWSVWAVFWFSQLVYFNEVSFIGLGPVHFSRAYQDEES